MTDCVFCKIVKKEIPAAVEKETDDFLIFKDVNPKAPVHLLIIPKKHYRDALALPDNLWKDLRDIARELAKEKNLDGFRLVTNTGEAAAVNHMHMHFLGEVGKTREI